MAEPEKNKPTPQEEVPESAAARRMHALGQDREEREPIQVEHVGFWENFWYHHKWKTIFIAAAVLIIGICVTQIAQRESPDVYVLYTGPGYITPKESLSLRDAFRAIMDDYNGDGERGIMLTDFNYLNPAQIEAKLAQAEAEGVDLTIDTYGNAAALEQFQMELVAGESVVCILDPAIYQSVCEGGGLMKLSEVLDTVPASAIDDYGIRFRETEFARYFTAAQVFPEDSVLCIRRVSAMAAFKGKKRIERMHNDHVTFFRALVGFTFPDGFTETTVP